jgi:integrase
MSQTKSYQITNYMTENMFYNTFLFWLIRLPPFINKSGRPPMNADGFVRLFRMLYGSGLRVSEALNLKKQDIDLNHRLVTITKAKTGYNQRTTILPYDVLMLEKHMSSLSKNDTLFPVNRHIVWEYGKNAGDLAGLKISEIQKQRTIDGVWTHLMRKSCSKRMRKLGASRELAMVKLRHINVGSHDTYDRPDLNELLNWEAEHFPTTFLINGEGNLEAQK